MRKCMNSLILALVLSSPNVHADRALVEVDGKDCIFKLIKYNEIDNLVWAVGNCQVLFDLCTKDFCKVEKFSQKDLNFGGKKNIGFK
jgi:hypothetical protein